MSQVRVIVVSPEEAYDGIAEFWCGAELMGVTILSEGERHEHGLEEATRLLAAY